MSELKGSLPQTGRDPQVTTEIGRLQSALDSLQELLEYAKRGLDEYHKILDDPEQSMNYDYWNGKRVVFERILEIASRLPKTKDVEINQRTGSYPFQYLSREITAEDILKIIGAHKKLEAKYNVKYRYKM